jgi:cysteine desulfurase/selenocysteine lyase
MPRMPAPARPEILDPPPLDRTSLDALLPGSRYFNVAGCGPTMPVARRAMEAFGRWLDSVAMFSHVGFAAYDAALAETRADLAAFLGDPQGASRVALVQSATAALNLVVSGLHFSRPARFVTTDREHASALLPLAARRERGDEVLIVPYAGDDAAFLSRLRVALRPGGALLLSHVSHKDGAVLPVREACDLARGVGAFVIVDGAQAVGQIAVDVRLIGCDAYCLLGHKWLHGPLATGALWLRDPRDERLVPPVVGWRSQERDARGSVALKPSAERFESGTVDVSAFVGLRQALAVHRALGAGVGERVRALRGRVLGALAELPLEVVSRPEDPTGIVTVRPRYSLVEPFVSRAWTEHGVVIKALVGAEEPDAVRISFWYLHDAAAIDDLTRALAVVV